MSEPKTVEVLYYARWMGAGSESVYDYVDFCGACRRSLGGRHGGAVGLGKPYHVEDLLAECEAESPLPRGGGGGEYEHWICCPWCGAAFDQEWWRGRPLQNPRVPDHFTNPGSHTGDAHLIDADDPGQHVVASSDPSYICWCGPEITPGLMGCEVRHRNVPMPGGDVSHGTPDSP